MTEKGLANLFFALFKNKFGLPSNKLGFLAKELPVSLQRRNLAMKSEYKLAIAPSLSRDFIAQKKNIRNRHCNPNTYSAGV